MPDFEFEFSPQDTQLIVTQDTSVFQGTDYIRLTIYSALDVNNIVTLPSSGESAIFYSSLNPIPFDINVSPFGSSLTELDIRNLGLNGTDNDFEIFKNGDDIYIKPNEILNSFGLPQGSYKIQIDFLNQLAPQSINVEPEQDNVSLSEVEENLGEELITNNDFTKPNTEGRIDFQNLSENYILDDDNLWDLPQDTSFGATIEDGVLIFDEAYVTGASSLKYSHQANPLVINETYRISFEIFAHENHTFRASVGNNLTPPVSGDGFYAFDVVYTQGANATYTYTGGNPDISDVRGTFKVRNFSVKKVLDTNIPNWSFGSPQNTTFLDYNETWNLTNGQLTLTGEGPGDNDYITQGNLLPAFTPTTKKYRLSIDIDSFIGERWIVSRNGITEGEYSIRSEDYEQTSGVFTIEFEGFPFDYAYSPRIHVLGTMVLNSISLREVLQEQLPENQPLPTFNLDHHYQFIIKEISTSRKEVRLKLLDENINVGHEIINNIKNQFNADINNIVQDKYQFRHLLNIGTGDHIPITNYEFDEITNGKDNQSIILKLYDTLPTNITNLSLVTIEKEVLTTQTENIFYFSDVPEAFFGTGLSPQPQENWINNDGNDIGYQTYNEISNSLSNVVLDSLVSQSKYNYPNLNTDFNEFENHTFFGSAKKKLQNFKTKVETIQGHYSEISKSLKVSSSLSGDSEFIIQKRKNLFDKVNQEIKTFTPYERFLYFDGQSNSTASAPGLGKNYAKSTPINTKNFFTGDNFSFTHNLLTQHDGFNVVYNHTTDSPLLELFAENFVQDKPFFNYSSSIYLSFLLKGTDGITQINDATGLDFENIQHMSDHTGIRAKLPSDSKFSSSIENPQVTSSAYQRYIFQTSHSYFTPNETEPDIRSYDMEDFDPGSNKFTMLSGSVKTQSFQIIDSLGKYPATVVTQSGAPFIGSFSPAGDLFTIVTKRIGGSETKITDVKITLNNPTNVLPFDTLYHTSSAEWTSWYNGMIDSASTFDIENIHSFENNLPLYIQESSDYNDMKDFLNLQGEQYDLIRNHIDSLGTLNDRGYKKTNAPPDNTLPILLQNMGWNAVNPFTSGSLQENLGDYLSGFTSVNDIKNATWRKTLNNLIYVYKTKGTKNSVSALMNIYGYPNDIVRFREFGGSTTAVLQNSPGFIKNTAPNNTKNLDTEIQRTTGSFSFETKPGKLSHYIFNNQKNRNLRLNWWMDDANVNTLQFIYKHTKTTQTQKIVESSGSGLQGAKGTINILSSNLAHHDGTILVISSSDGTGKTYIFDDDNDGASGTLDGSGRVRIQINGKTNVDQIASEVSTSISSPNGHFGKIEVESLQFFTSNNVPLVTSGGLSFFANSDGVVSLTQLTGGSVGNLAITTNNPSASVVGFQNGTVPETLWDLRLVPSSNGVSSSFSFRLNNSLTGSNNITGSAVSMSTQHLVMNDGDLYNVMLQRMSSSISGSGVQEYRLHAALQNPAIPTQIRNYGYVTMSVSGGTAVDSNHLANQNFQSSGSRHYLSSSNLIFGETFSGSISEIRGWATTLSTSRFRQHTLNKFSTAGNTINSHRKELLYHYKLNENHRSGSAITSSNQDMAILDVAPKTFLTRSYTLIKSSSLFISESIYGKTNVNSVVFGIRDNFSRKSDKLSVKNPRKKIIGNLNRLRPAVLPISKPEFNTSTRLEINKSPSDFIDNFILDKLVGFDFESLYGNPNNYYSQSYDEFLTFREEFFKSYPITIDTNKFIRKHEALFNQSVVDGIKTLVPARSTFNNINSNIGVEIRPTILEKQKYENHKASLVVNPNLLSGSINPVVANPTSEIVNEKSASIQISVSEEANIINAKSASISISVNETMNIETPKTGSITITPTKEISIVNPSSGSINVNPSKVFTIVNEKSGSLSVLPSLSDTQLNFPQSGSINQNDRLSKSYVNIHNSWGTSSSDVKFLNLAATDSGSESDFNVNHIDPRFVFRMIGDSELYSGSGLINHMEIHNFYNRVMISDGVHKNIQYTSLVNGNPGLQTGRMIGKTRYFITGSDGNIILPPNHITKFLDEFKVKAYKGTQNINPGILNVQYDDYSTASFYRVNVTGGENELIARQNTQPTIGSGDKIIY